MYIQEKIQNYRAQADKDTESQSLTNMLKSWERARFYTNDSL